jgi:hypothetical protein
MQDPDEVDIAAGCGDTAQSISKTSADVVEAYRQGLGLAAVAVIGQADEIRIAVTSNAAEAVQARWWCRRVADAERVAKAATARLRRHAAGEGLSNPGDSVAAAARQLDIVLASDEETIAAANDAASRIDQEIERMQQRGELKAVNASYRQYRIDASSRGEKVVPYRQWMRKYRANLVRALAATLRDF